MNQFNIDTNEFLKTATIGYYHETYPFDNNHAVNILKNTYKRVESQRLIAARDYIVDKIITDIPIIVKQNDFKGCALVCVPRSKTWFTPVQLMFKDAVSIAANELEIIDGTDYIKRTIDTYTTHFRKLVPDYDNNGSMPYVGITIDTCTIDSNNIDGKDIILIDDVYTIGSNVIEDCIQALLDHGAKRVIHYSICKTPKGR